MLAPCPVRPQPPDADQRKDHAEDNHQRQRLLEMPQHGPTPALDVTPDPFHKLLLLLNGLDQRGVAKVLGQLLIQLGFPRLGAGFAHHPGHPGVKVIGQPGQATGP